MNLVKTWIIKSLRAVLRLEYLKRFSTGLVIVLVLALNNFSLTWLSQSGYLSNKNGYKGEH